MKRGNFNHKEFYTKKATSILLIIGISCIAANLRAPLTSIGPLVILIRDSLHMSDTLAGMITTLPLFAFALFSPLVPKLARRFGAEVVLCSSVILLTIGIFIRSSSGSFGLFLGTAILGLSISAGNVLIPSLIKKAFPRQIGVMTGIYSVFMNVFAALASGISIPLAIGLGFGWRGSLKLWAILSFLSVITWIPQLRKKHHLSMNDEKTKENDTMQLDKKVTIWKSPLAWQVTIYMGLQSMVFYCMVAWLPNILMQQGINANKAGWMLSLMQLALIPMTFIASVFAGRKANQKILVVMGSICVMVGLLGLLMFGKSNFVFIWIIILGIGGGFTFSLAMMFISTRTHNADEAARLSGMAQSIGYLLAAFGPMFFGYMHDIANTWTVSLILLITFAFICFLSGLGASRDLYISTREM